MHYSESDIEDRLDQVDYFCKVEELLDLVCKDLSVDLRNDEFWFPLYGWFGLNSYEDAFAAHLNATHDVVRAHSAAALAAEQTMRGELESRGYLQVEYPVPNTKYNWTYGIEKAKEFTWFQVLGPVTQSNPTAFAIHRQMEIKEPELGWWPRIEVVPVTYFKSPNVKMFGKDWIKWDKAIIASLPYSLGPVSVLPSLRWDEPETISTKASLASY